jgi:hypothetical protein
LPSAATASAKHAPCSSQPSATTHLSSNSAESLDLAQRCLDLLPHDERAELCAALILAFNSNPERAASLAHDVARRLPSLDIAAAIPESACVV